MRERCSRSLAGLILAVGSFFSVAVAVADAAIDAPFRDLSAESLAGLPPRGEYEAPLPLHFRALEVDLGALEDLLALAPAEGGAAALAAPLILTLPYPDGSDQRFRVEESPILEAALARRFPEIRTFTVQGLDDPTASGRVSLTSLGFHAMVMSSAGTLYIDPYRRWQGEVVLAYFHSQAIRRPGDAPRCEFKDEDAVAWNDSDGSAAEAFAEAPGGPASAIASGSTLRTYRLALAATVEYSTRVCLPNPVAVPCALNAIVVSMNRVGGVYEREVAVRMVLIANNDLIVYIAEPDPYTNNNGGAMLGQNQTNLTAVIGSANYDIGHVFSTGGGGVASLSVPCVNASKARGVTGLPNPIGDPFDVDFVAHEMGHQWGGLHTFNGTTSNCGGGNRSASAAYEPGSGSTIMAYAGICGAENLQLHSDDIFHTKSFDQIVAYSTGATGNSCAVGTATGNTPPEVDAGPAFTIPKQTPFTLTGSATDGDGDSLTYLWEEYDLGAAAPPNNDIAAARPIFRSFVPLTVPSRTFPRLSDILNNVATIGESMSTRDRTMTFRLTARDNRTGGGGVDWDSTAVTVSAAAGPFLVTQPNTALVWAGNSVQTVTWDVAGTDGGPITCAAVAIDLSTDGGATFGTVLAAATPNDGSAAALVPDAPTTQARVRVTCVGNIFFDISNVNFTITAGGPVAPFVASVCRPAAASGAVRSSRLTGLNFVDGATVAFGGVPAALVTFNDATSISATSPVHAAGSSRRRGDQSRRPELEPRRDVHLPARPSVERRFRDRGHVAVESLGSLTAVW